MKKNDKKKNGRFKGIPAKIISLCAVLIIAACLMFSSGSVTLEALKSNDTYGLTLSEFASAHGAMREKLTEGVSNIIKRGRQMYEISWTSMDDITSYPGSGDELVFRKGITYKGIPYGQPVHKGKYVGFNASIEDFASAAADPSSIMYTERGENTWYYTEGLGDIKYGPYYASDCSAFISYVWELPDRYTTSMIAERTLKKTDPGYSSAMFQYVGRSVDDLRTGYALNKGGSHIILVYDVLYDSTGKIVQVTTLEQTPPIMRLRVWGAGGNSGTLNDLQNKIENSPYDIIRYRDMENVTFSESQASPLNAEIYENRITQPISSFCADGTVNGTAYAKSASDTSFRLEGWTYHRDGVSDIEYSIDGGEWKKAEISEYGALTSFSSDLPSTSGSYIVKVRGSSRDGVYDIAEITVNGSIYDITYLACFENIGGYATEVVSNAPYEGNVELEKGSQCAVNVGGWAISTDGISGFEYKIDDGIWISLEANFRSDVARAYKAYNDMCNVYNQVTGYADFSAFNENSEHTLYVRAVTSSSNVIDIARINVKIQPATISLFGIEIQHNIITIVISGIILAAAIILVIIMIVKAKGSPVKSKDRGSQQDIHAESN